MEKFFTFILLIFMSVAVSQAQMWNGTDTLYGNEWINHDQSYYKILVAKDGMYRISRSAMESAGIDVNDIQGNRFQLFHKGEEKPVYVSTSTIFGANDYIEFYGEKNRSALDEYLFSNPQEELLNPEYSMFSDTSVYFLTWTAPSQQTNRFSIVQNDLNNLPPKEQYFLYEKKAVLTSASIKKAITTGIFYSTYETGEGFANGFTTSLEVSVPADHIYTSVNESNLKVRLATSVGSHDLSISLNGSQILFDQPNGWTLKQYNSGVLTSLLNGSDKVLIKGNYDANDKHAVANVILTYPRAFNFNNQTGFQFKIQPGNFPMYLEIENFNSGGTNPVLYDITNGIRIVTQLDGDLVKVKLPGSSQERTLFLVNDNTGADQVSLQPVNFVNYAEMDANYIIISNKRLFNDGNGNNRVQEYADYRSSMQGRDFDVVVVEVQQLYDQFAYGISRHPLSFRNFGHFIKKEWNNPEYVFIIGKGREYQNIRTPAQLNSEANQTFFVPTFGRPGSDNLLFAGINTSIPVIPVSRIAASVPEEIKTYLEKVKTHEANINNPQTIEDKLWMKRVLHLSGGGSGEQGVIEQSLLNMAKTIINNKFGAEVITFKKHSSDPIQNGADAIFKEINDGVSIITFFGHSAVGTWDFSIDNESNYHNYGKYPLVLSLGCYSGNIHTNGDGISERFVFLKDGCAIAVGASIGQAHIPSLRSLGNKYYDLAGSDEFYGAGIGKLLQETIRNLDHMSISSSTKTLLQQFTLHGDPAVRLNPSPGPDYIVDPASVSFEPNIITAQMDSFRLNFSVLNIGVHQEDSITVKVTHQLPGGEERESLTIRIPSPAFSNQHSYNLPTYGNEATGINVIHINVDADDDVDELPSPAAESNNFLMNANGSRGIPFFIFDNSAKPVYPVNYAIVNEPVVKLKASTTDGLAPSRKYIMEIDTSQLFNSPMKVSTEIIQAGGVLKWQPQFPFTSNTVYYWRVSPDSVNTQNGYLWENSSFVYLPASEKGWNQSHYYQLLTANDSSEIFIDSNRVFNFKEKYTYFRIKNKYRNVNAQEPAQGFINTASWSDFFRWNIPQSVTVAVFHEDGANDIFGPTYSHLWFNFNPGEYGSVNSNAPRIASFPFPSGTTQQRENIINFLNNIVPDSAYVCVYTALTLPTNTLNVGDWAADSLALGGANLFNVLESFGATQIRDMPTNGALPYIFAFRKAGAVLFEQMADGVDDVVNFEYLVPASLDEGEFNSIKVGPALSWDKVIWDFEAMEIADTASLSVYGVSATQTDSLGMMNEAGELDISWVNAAEYPFVTLKLRAKDEENQTPVHLNYWRVLFEGLPDAAVASNVEYDFQRDTVQQGEEAILRLAVENVSDYDMDSLLLKITLINPHNVQKDIFKRVAPLEKDAVHTAEFVIDTREMNDFQNLVFEINPDDDQPELHRFNNYAVKQFFVERDKQNPLLDVTFDGVHIMDGDIVSPKPNIYITLKDENKFLELSDTSLFKLFIKYPGDYVVRNISFQDEWVKFFPASANDLGTKNKAYIELNPEFEQDGIYQLLVQARDASGNQSGDVDYKVNFEVINKQMLSNVLNYPNPFSTSTQFVYTLTGSEIPEYFKIQIMTVSGKIVREITQDEIGPLRVGTHRTDYRWDGTDEYGGRLANGVYLYRVVAKKSFGENYETYHNGTDTFFKKGFGKLVIMR